MVIKIGGSLLYDSEMKVNKDILERISKWYKTKKDSKENIALVTGGGKLSRTLGEFASDFAKNQYDIHSIAMEATQVNSYILKAYLNDDSFFVPEKLGDAYEYLIDGDFRRMVSGGLKHGWSTDMDAAVFADILKEKEVFKLTDVEGVYTDDPRKNHSATLIKEISWTDFMKTFDITEEVNHKPNSHVPVSPETAVFCSKKGITMYIAGGKYLNENISTDEILKMGTRIHP